MRNIHILPSASLRIYATRIIETIVFITPPLYILSNKGNWFNNKEGTYLKFIHELKGV